MFYSIGLMLPVVLASGLEPRYKLKWQKQFVANNRECSEGIWRRTQQKETASKSGWRSHEDSRRRMIHFLDRYNVVENLEGTYDFVIEETYLWMSVTLPGTEIINYKNNIDFALNNAKWRQSAKSLYKNGPFNLEYKFFDNHPEDIKTGRHIPENYKTLEFTFYSEGVDITHRLIDSPWRILNSGIRKQGTRTDKPDIRIDINDIQEFLPAQFELGGGASIEMGIPPLNHLHQTYCVTEKKTGSFIFGQDSFLVDLIQDPVNFYKKAASAYTKCLLAEPNSFYKTLQKLYEANLAVGDVITNNFDGISSLVGLNEKYVRRYDEPKHFPEVSFHPDAKSLIVVGSHADRREVQKQAREKGLKIIYIDPENYVDYYGNKIDYPLEHLQQEDILYQMTATEFAQQIRSLL